MSRALPMVGCVETLFRYGEVIDVTSLSSVTSLQSRQECLRVCVSFCVRGIGTELSSNSQNNGQSIVDYMRKVRDHVHINGFHFQTVNSAEVETLISHLGSTGPGQYGLLILIFMK